MRTLGRVYGTAEPEKRLADLIYMTLHSDDTQRLPIAPSDISQAAEVVGSVMLNPLLGWAAQNPSVHAGARTNNTQRTPARSDRAVMQVARQLIRGALEGFGGVPALHGQPMRTASNEAWLLGNDNPPDWGAEQRATAAWNLQHHARTNARTLMRGYTGLPGTQLGGAA